jgi:hypothetical protein
MMRKLSGNRFGCSRSVFRCLSSAAVGLGVAAILTALAGCGGAGGSSRASAAGGEKVLAGSLSCPHRAPQGPRKAGVRQIRYPTDPVGATLCRFSLLRSAAEDPSGQLVRERRLGAIRASETVALFNRAKPLGREERGGRGGNCPADNGTRILVRLQFAAESEVLVSVVPTGCRGIQQVRPLGRSLLLSYTLEQDLLRWSHPQASI